MDSNDAADLITEVCEDDNNAANERFRNRAALLIAVLAAVLAIGGLGGGNATDDMIGHNIHAGDAWAFYQAKNIRQNMYRLAADDVEAELASGSLAGQARTAAEERLGKYRATVDRYESEPDPKAPDDPLRGEGKKEIMARAKAFEAAREDASLRDTSFDLAEVALQLAIVLGSVAILAVNRWILGLSLGLGVLGAILTANGFVLLVPLG
jgi:hypothetical protein